MSDLQGAVPDPGIWDHSSLDEWLATKSPDICMVVVARSALRNFLFLKSPDPNALLAILHANAMAWYAARYPGQARLLGSFGAAANSVKHNTGLMSPGPANAASAAYKAAALAAAIYGDSSAVGDALVQIHRVLSPTQFERDRAALKMISNAELWRPTSEDAKATDNINSPSLKASDPLWLSGTPEWASNRWSRLKAAVKEEHWTPWLEWYQRRLDGRELLEETEFLFATLPLDPREQAPSEQNALLAAEIARLTKKDAQFTSENISSEPPELPQPGPAPKMVVQDEQLDLALHRQADEPPLGKRSTALLNELRETTRDFENTFDSRSNAHAQIRKVLRRYQDQIDLDDPDVDTIFALGLRFENAARAAAREIEKGFEPTLEDSQQEALASVLQIHAVFIASDPDGVELLEAADRYSFNPAEDVRFKASAEPVADRIRKAPNLVKERAVELLREVLAEMGEGEHPTRTGLVGRNTTQSVLVKLAQAAILGVVGSVAGQILIHTGTGQLVISNGAMFSDKAIAFFLNNAPDLRALAAVAPEGFGFLSRVIDWLKMKLEL
jgi:hypothetical protein